MEQFFTPENMIALFTLTALEIVLGIDNIIFISILVNKLPETKRGLARTSGLALAMGMRILLLFSISFILSFTLPLFTIFHNEISGRDLVLIAGGLFLIWKSTFEVHSSLEGEEHEIKVKGKDAFISILIQIMLLDIIFSIDSVITAIGMVENLLVMATAIVVAVIIMMFSAKSIGDFVEAHPTIKMLALSFLILVGVMLIAESLDFHIPRGYIYFSLAFSIGVEMLNIRLRKKVKPIDLKDRLK